MPIERLDKTDRLEPWRVQATTDSSKGKEEGEEKEQGKDVFASLHDKTDWQILFNKKSEWKTGIQVLREEIDQILFRKINLKTDPSLLRIDIILKGGEKISPAFIAISRAIGLKIKDLNSGDPIPEPLIMKGNILRVTTPSDPKRFAEWEKRAKKEAPKSSNAPGETEEDFTIKKARGPSFLERLKIKDPATRQTRVEIALIYGMILFILLMVIWGTFLLF